MQHRRDHLGALNSVKCPELGQLLYDWFIDCIQVYKARLSYGLFLWKARHLKQRLLDAGYEPQAMPTLEGEAAKSWLRRWRKKFDVVIRRRVKHLKVSWKKLKERVRVYLENAFVLRFLWFRCYGETDEMGVVGPETSLVQQHRSRWKLRSYRL